MPKLSQARRLVEKHCTHGWVEEGISIRRLKLSESIIARAKAIKDSEPLGYAEIPGIHFELKEGELAATNREMLLAYEAQAFFAAEMA
jgi:hypothetical protein